jgi:hypothetical protein
LKGEIRAENLLTVRLMVSGSASKYYGFITFRLIHTASNEVLWTQKINIPEETVKKNYGPALD